MNPLLELGHCSRCRRRVWQAPDGGERVDRGRGLHWHRQEYVVRLERDGPPSDRP